MSGFNDTDGMENMEESSGLFPGMYSYFLMENLIPVEKSEGNLYPKPQENTSHLLPSPDMENNTHPIVDNIFGVKNLANVDETFDGVLKDNSTFTRFAMANGSRTPSVTFAWAFYGFPAFCSNSAPELCADVPIMQCQECNMPAAGLLLFVIIALALGIILSNLAVVILFAREKSSFTGSCGKIKASLAVADMLTGLLLLCIALPNIAMTLNSTANDLLRFTISLQGSALASAGGVLYLLIYTSSLYHLAFLCQQRFFAIKWPISYKHQPMRITYIGLAIVWSIALLCALSPLCFPNLLTFGYQHLIFLFNVTLVTTDHTPFVAMFVAIFIVPYVLMTILSALTGYYVAKNARKSSQIQSTLSARKREVIVFATLAAMQLGFTITLVPVVVIVFMSYADILNSNNVAVPYLTCYYMSMSNSLVNVLVYSVADQKFRRSVVDFFCICCPKTKQNKSNTSSTAAEKSRKGVYSKSSQVNVP